MHLPHLILESKRQRKEISGYILAVPDLFDKNSLMAVSIVYDVPRDATEYHTRVTDNLEDLLYKEVEGIKAWTKPVAIPFHTHKDLQRPSEGDIKSLRELYEFSKEHPELPFYFPNFGIILVEEPPTAIAFDINGRYRRI